MSLKAIIDDLAKAAGDQIERAYRILGAKPGPGVDLLIYPVQPLCGKWHVTGLTPAGQGFVSKFWFAQPFEEIRRLKAEAEDWQLKYRVEYPVVSLEVDDGRHGQS
jgi:hypothetical protein